MARKTLDDFTRGENAVKMMLAVDLGNSRTAIALYDQIDNDEGRAPKEHTDIPLVWEATESAEVRTMRGPFDSRVSTVLPNAADPSFTRIGKQAWHNERAFVNAKRNGDHTLSSPKRYFFDTKASRRGWLCAEQTKAGTVDDLKGEFPDALAHRYGFGKTPSLPRAAMLGAMVAEFYLQADKHANSAAFKKDTNDDRRRFISHVCLTYPTTFTDDERKRYVLQIDKALRVLFACCAKFADVPFVEIVAGIDEGTAVLAYYADMSLGKFGTAEAWLTTVGRQVRRNPDVYASSMAVIDIGGGTTDVAVVHLTGGKLAHVDMQLLYREGVNRAGDDFIAEFAQRWLFDRFLKALYPQSLNIPDIKNAYNRQVQGNPEAIRILSSLACSAVAAIGKTKGGISVPVTLSGDQCETLNKVFSEGGKNKLDEKGVSAKIAVTAEDAVFCENLAAEVFGPTMTRMARVIAAFGCDRLLLSGKTCEFDVVKRLIFRTVALPPFCIVPVSEAMNGRDVKYATVLGGGIIGLKNIATNTSASIGFSIGEAMRTKFAWGYENNVNQRVLRIREGNNKLELNADGFAEIEYRGKDIYIIRQCYGKNSVVCVSHRIKHTAENRRVDSSAKITIRINNDGRVRIVRAEGAHTDGSHVSADDFECVNFSQTDNGHWMDDGRVPG